MINGSYGLGTLCVTNKNYTGMQQIALLSAGRFEVRVGPALGKRKAERIILSFQGNTPLYSKGTISIQTRQIIRKIPDEYAPCGRPQHTHVTSSISTACLRHHKNATVVVFEAQKT